MPSPALIVPLSANRFPNKLAPKVLNNIPNILKPNKLFMISASVANAAAVNPNGVITLLANGLSTLPGLPLS